MGQRCRITPRDLGCMLADETAEPKALPLSLLEEITNDFSDEQEIGRGGFAVVYKGILSLRGKLENRNVAVKRMIHAYMYENEYQREVECLMRVKHKNVVRFLGYCANTQGSATSHEGKFVIADVRQRLLCFEYLPNGSLLEYITDTSSRLQWRQRYQIINGICHGLHYLHQNNIVHLDLKPGNILLDPNLVAKIADFGLSRCFADMQSRLKTTKIRGTIGYLAPEFTNGEITYLLDIYSLGVIIMEILTGKKGHHDVDKVVGIWINMLEKSWNDVQMKQVRICAEIGIECIDSNPEKRPDTKHIVDRLKEIESMDKYIETGVITSQQVENVPNELQQDMTIALGETSSKVTDSPTKQVKQYASSEARPMPIKPGSVQLVIKNNSTVAPLLEYKKKVLLQLTGGDYTSDRPGLDLVVVVDVSGSMKRQKIEQLKTAMRFLVRKLSPMDRLAVITFSIHAKELWPLQQVTEASSRRELEDLISKLDPSFDPYIGLGLQAGINVLADRKVRAGRVAGIMLLSGARYNYGEAASVDVGNVPVYTFCFVGTDTSVLMELNKVAAKSLGGTFSHVVDTGGLTMAFSQCLAGLLTVSVQNLELTVAAVRGESTIVKVTTGSYPQERHKNEKGDSVTVRFGNLYSSEVRKVIVELLLPTIYRERSAEILDVIYTHNSSTGSIEFVPPAETLTVLRTHVDFIQEEKPAGLVSEEARLQTAQMIKEARTMADCNRLAYAKIKLVEAQHMQCNSLLLKTELQELLELFKTQETYEKQGRPYALSAESCHYRQRLAGRVRLFATPRMDKYLEQATKFLNEPTMPLSSVDDDIMDEVGTLTINVSRLEEEMHRLALDVVRVRVPVKARARPLCEALSSDHFV